MKLTEQQIAVIEKYVDGTLINKDRLIQYLEKHRIIKNDVFAHCSLLGKKVHFDDEAYCGLLDHEAAYTPVSREIFIRRIPFYFHCPLRADGKGHRSGLWYVLPTREDSLSAVDLESIYQALELMYYDLGLSIETIFKYCVDQVHRQRKVKQDPRQGLLYSIDKVKKFCDYAEYVLELKQRTGLAPTTLERYRSMLPRINDAIGHLKLTQIRPQHLNDLYKHLTDNGIRNKGAIATAKKVLKSKLKALGMPKCKIAEEAGISHTTLNSILRGDSVKLETAEGLAKAMGYTVSELFTVSDRKKPLSDKTILEHHRLISMIMAQADKELLIPYNPAAKATPPKVSKKEADYFQPEEVFEIIKALETAPLKWKAMTYILIDTGCRRGELMGLQWNCVDLDKGILMIKQALLYTKNKGVYVGPPKTGRPRAVCLAPETVALLKKYRTEQLRTKMRHADIWQDTGFLFTKDDGTVMHPDSITDWLDKFSAANDLPHIHPHAFRHTAASTMIANGVDLVTAATELGHANATTTANIYAHQVARARAAAGGVRAGVFSILKEA